MCSISAKGIEEWKAAETRCKGIGAGAKKGHALRRRVCGVALDGAEFLHVKVTRRERSKLSL